MIIPALHARSPAAFLAAENNWFSESDKLIIILLQEFAFPPLADFQPKAKDRRGATNAPEFYYGQL